MILINAYNRICALCESNLLAAFNICFEHFVLWSCHSMHQYKEPRAVATPHQVVRDLNANVSEFLPGSFIPKVPECARMTDVSSYLACGKLFTPIHIHIHICIYASLTSYVLKLLWTNFNVKGLT